jgi:hypothetical protein
MTITSEMILNLTTESGLVNCLKVLAKRDASYRKDSKSIICASPYIFIGDVYKALNTTLRKLVVTRPSNGIGLRPGIAKKLEALGVRVSILPNTTLSLTIGDSELRIFINPE